MWDLPLLIPEILRVPAPAGLRRFRNQGSVHASGSKADRFPATNYQKSLVEQTIDILLKAKSERCDEGE